MNLFEKTIPQYLPSVAVGVGVALVAPMLLVAAVSLMRPLAKAAIKGGFIVKDTAMGAYSLAGTQLEKLTGKTKAKPLAAAPKAKGKLPREEAVPETTEP